MPQTADHDKYLAARKTIGECQFLFDAILWALHADGLDLAKKYALDGLKTAKKGVTT